MIVVEAAGEFQIGPPREWQRAQICSSTLVVRGTGGSRNMLMIVGLQMAVGVVALIIPAAVLEWGQPIEWSWRLVFAFLYTVAAPGLAAMPRAKRSRAPRGST